jgi:hypothetical protein
MMLVDLFCMSYLGSCGLTFDSFGSGSTGTTGTTGTGTTGWAIASLPFQSLTFDHSPNEMCGHAKMTRTRFSTASAAATVMVWVVFNPTMGVSPATVDGIVLDDALCKINQH